jgi:hypothetical protein
MLVTRRGRYRTAQWISGRAALPANYFVALVTDAVVPADGTVTFGELTEIAAGNGYTSGGMSISLNSTDFDEESETPTWVRMRNLVWTATGGPLPASGDPAVYAVVLLPNATVADREVFSVHGPFDPGLAVSEDQPLTLTDLQLDFAAI